MGMQEEAQSAPDTYGLPEYFVTDVRTEITGSNVRIICGVRRGGVIHWLYSSVFPADVLLGHARCVSKAAEQAFNLQQMMDGGRSH